MLAPHGDDESLFAAALSVWHRPHLIVCTHSGPERMGETMQAWSTLVPDPEADVEFWPYADDVLRTDYGGMADRIKALPKQFDRCIAPLWESGGHEHHNHVAHQAMESFGPDRLIRYATYRRGHGRTVTAVESPADAVWVERKLRALACYRSQIADPKTQPWFLGLMNEWTA